MTELVGHTIHRYQITGELGRGGMAVVYLAFDPGLGREVALKLIRREGVSADLLDSMLKRFEREARALARLAHPNIIQVYDYGQHQGSPYLVMQYVPGGSLKLPGGQPMPYRQAARILLPVARALQYAHQHNIIHRDLKPANILMDPSGEPMVSDFGIAKIMQTEESTSLTGTGVGIGTPEYMAPEQGMGGEIDGRADIYSLGIILYEMVTGVKPFTGPTPISVVIQHISAPLPSPHLKVSDLPEHVEQVICKALAKNRNERYASMADFAYVLHRMQELAEQRQAASAPAPVRTVQVEPAAPLKAAPSPRPTETPSIAKKPVVQPRVSSAQAGISPRQAPPAARMQAKSRSPWLSIAGIAGVGLAGMAALVIIGVLLNNNGFFNPQSTVTSLAASPTTQVQAQVTLAATPTLAPSVTAMATVTLAPSLTATPAERSLVINGEPLQINPAPVSVDNAARLSLLGEIKQNAIVSSDAQTLVQVNEDVWYLYRLSDGQVIARMIPHSQNWWENRIVYSPDGSLVCAILETRQVGIWDAHSGKLLRSIELPANNTVDDMGFSPDTQRLAVSYHLTRDPSNNGIRVWDVVNGSVVNTISNKPFKFTPLVFSPDGSRLAVSAYNSHDLWIWDLTQPEYTRLTGHASTISAFVFSPDGTWLASTSSAPVISSSELRLWNAVSGELIFQEKQDAPWAHALAISKDGHWLINSADNVLRLWEVVTRGDTLELRQAGEFATQTGIVQMAGFSPDGSLVASINTGGLFVWGTDTHERIYAYKSPDAWSSAWQEWVFSQDGSLIQAGPPGDVGSIVELFGVAVP
jgi:serine/threonine protein kinase/WD40 repeat protein